MFDILFVSDKAMILSMHERLSLCHKDTAKGKKFPLVGGIGCLELCLYGIRELA